MVLTSHRDIVAELNRRCQSVVQLGEPVYEGGSASRESFNKQSRVENRKFHLRDKVIMLKNNYLVGQMNGDMGRITEIGQETLTVKFHTGRLIDFYLPKEKELATGKYSKTRQLNTSLLDLAFCTTVHKAQGKQAPVMILYIKSGLHADKATDTRMFNQCWLYTALSRAQEEIYCVGDIEALNWMAATGPPFRHDCLAQWIEDYIAK